MSNAPLALPTPAQVLNMTPQQRASTYTAVKAANPAEFTKLRTKVTALQSSWGSSYMRRSIQYNVVCPQSSGGALTQAYVPGAVLTFQVPTAQNSFTEGFWFRAVLSAVVGAGSSAVYAKNAAFPLNLWDNIQVSYNGQLHNFRPYIMSTLNRMQGRSRSGIPLDVIAGQTVSTNDVYRDNGQLVTSGTRTWDHEWYFPLNLLGPLDVRGIVPTMGGETRLEVSVTCAPAANTVGNDPILNLLSVVSGTGHTLAVTGTLAVYAQQRAGWSYDSNKPLPLSIAGLQTTQLVRDQITTTMASATTTRTKVTLKGKMPWYIITVIDGVQATSFSLNSNLAILETLRDAAGTQALERFGTGTNMSALEFFNRIYMEIGQDIDQGIYPLMRGPIQRVPDADDLNGAGSLIVGPAGWADFHYGVQMTTIGSVCTPRIEAHAVLLNAPLVN